MWFVDLTAIEIPLLHLCMNDMVCVWSPRGRVNRGWPEPDMGGWHGGAQVLPTSPTPQGRCWGCGQTVPKDGNPGKASTERGCIWGLAMAIPGAISNKLTNMKQFGYQATESRLATIMWWSQHSRNHTKGAVLSDISIQNIYLNCYWIQVDSYTIFSA